METEPMDKRTAILLGALVAAGGMIAWLVGDDSTPEKTAAPASQPSVVAPSERIPGLPYNLGARRPSTTTRSATGAYGTWTDRAARQSSVAGPPQGYRFRPLEPGQQTDKRYRPYQLPPSAYGQGYDNFRGYPEEEPPAFGTIEPPAYQNYQFRPLDKDQSRRHKPGGFRPMSAPPTSLASPGEGRLAIPHPS